MLKRFVTLVVLAAVAVCVMFSAGCETEAQNSALLGTAIGAGVGALAGGDTEGALIGGAIGGGVGYVAGNESEKKKTEQIKRTPVQISKPSSTFGGVSSGNSFSDIMKPSQDWGPITPEKQSFYPTVNGSSKRIRRRKRKNV